MPFSELLKRASTSYASKAPYRYPSEMDSPLTNCVTSVILVSNLHCNSCVRTIEDALSHLNPPPVNVDVNIVLGSVTVVHPSLLHAHDIRSAILSAGFDVAQETEQSSLRPSFKHGLHSKHIENCEQCRNELSQRDTDASSSEVKRPLPPQESSTEYKVSLSIGGMTCSACTNTVSRLLSDVDGVRDARVSLLDNSASATIRDESLCGSICDIIEDAGYEATVISVEPLIQGARGPFRVLLSIGGMTCSSCTNTVTDILSGKKGVREVKVNLLDHSATAIVDDDKMAPTLCEAIEDVGYEARIVNVSPLQDGSAASLQRVIKLRVDGMFCKHCPPKVLAALEKHTPEVEVLKPLTFSDPVLALKYQPDVPALTIRRIIEAVKASETQFSVSIHHDPTIEQLARVMQRKESTHTLYRLLLSIVAAIPTLIIGIVYMSLVPDGNSIKMFFMEPMWAGNASRAEWALLFLATPVMFLCADLFHKRSLRELRALWRPGSKTPILYRFIRFGSMNLLVSMGVSIAYFSSIALLAMAASEEPSVDGVGDSTTYFDSVIFLTMFLLAGRYLESYSKVRTADAVTSLLTLRPNKAILVSDEEVESTARDSLQDVSTLELGDAEKEELRYNGGSVKMIDADLLEVGDVVRVPRGSTPPVDGTVVAGKGTIFDESSLTGESKPVSKSVGDKVFLGTINKSAVVDIRVDAVGGGTVLDNIVKVMREGQTRRAPIESVADIITGYFVPVVTALAILTWVIWLALGMTNSLPPGYLDISIGGWPVWSLKFSIAVFVVACPCGIGLAAPTALLVSSGVAAKHGILSRGGGDAFQEMSQLDLLVFDKTGTLTEGEPKVTNHHIVSDGQWSKEAILGVAVELESASAHPLAAAIVSFCKESDLSASTGSFFDETPGRGIKGVFNEVRSTAIIGNEAFMSDNRVEENEEISRLTSQWKSQGQTVVLLAVGRNGSDERFQVRAAFGISDKLRAEARGVVEGLQKQGIHTWLLSGDSAVEAVKTVALQVGIPPENVMAGVMPHEKAEKVLWLQRSGIKRGNPNSIVRESLDKAARTVVGMVGDGVNDAPALTTADVGIAIGSGSDIAITSASFILMRSDLRKLITLLDLSRRTIRRVKFNFLWALVYNMAAVPIAAGVIYPYHHARLDPVWASLAMALSSVSVVCSSLMLKLYREPKLGS